MQTTIECGFYDLTETTVFHYAGFECAAWSIDTRVEPGRYPVTASIKDGRVEEFCCCLPGVIACDYFPALFGGMAIGKPYDVGQNAGKPSSYMLRFPTYLRACAKPELLSPWHIDFSVLPNIGRCVHCHAITFGSDHSGLCLCTSCAVIVSRGDSFMAVRRFPRLLSLLSHDGEYGRIADQALASAVYNRCEYSRKRIAGNIRMIRAARRQFPQVLKARSYWVVYPGGNVGVDGSWIGRVQGVR